MPAPWRPLEAGRQRHHRAHKDGTVRVRFKPTPAHLTPIAMDHLTTRYADAVSSSKQDALVLVPLTILDFPLHTSVQRR